MNQIKPLFIPEAATLSYLEIPFLSIYPVLAWSSGHGMPQCSNLCNTKMNESNSRKKKGIKKNLSLISLYLFLSFLSFHFLLFNILQLQYYWWSMHSRVL